MADRGSRSGRRRAGGTRGRRARRGAGVSSTEASAATSPPASRPAGSSASRTTSAASTSPATTRAARCGTAARAWTARSSVGVSPDGVRGAARRPVVRARGRVDRADVRLVGAPARVGLRLDDVGQALVAEAVDLRFRERGPADDLGQQLQRGTEPRGRDVHARRRRVPAGLGVERRAEALGGLGQLDRVAQLRALGQAAGREHRRAGLPGGLVGGAGPAARCDAETSSRPGIGATITRTPLASWVRIVSGKSYGRGWPGTGPLGDEVRGRAPCRRLRRLVGRLSGRRSGPRGCPPGTPRPRRPGSAPASPTGSVAAAC